MSNPCMNTHIRIDQRRADSALSLAGPGALEALLQLAARTLELPRGYTRPGMIDSSGLNSLLIIYYTFYNYKL